ncbi:hypothetical protein A2634_03445 [Candidatus Amesbacteria bacterium RIFCSPHIGHO2_01_FULL_48_32]|uniref:Uncharacterized protein n=1 Tax=Candidatus Amesbacteria bacterium RIFCSPLOWO2_01_FULL_48_25 TaxID=1797259 RepID=A0A1F4ZDD8_9BACT|nr:MAG: hypothetical protein A2634_03445 [Candidatus Amesbacteria bacterium RIFCSPHIGHO2_01_FULL_48_32]OGD04311.1 MAG: hypothetical protein A2989_04710 [Candidatus Amesbacteria bacterium RIFCSPLOWO2_01_FULL_48_25]HJZ05512.1 hypothetical protein [Patescibacteria group bacterium]
MSSEYNLRYWTHAHDAYQLLPLKEIIKLKSQTLLWSARIGTGLLGLTDCSSGKRGPKNSAEIILAIGSTGLAQLIKLGFIPCPTCRPDQLDTFWEIATEMAREKYRLQYPRDFTNKKIVGFDALRLDWETILNITKRPPSRIYTSPKPDQNLLSKTIDAFLALSIPLPPIGFYNRTAPGNFTEIDIGHS